MNVGRDSHRNSLPARGLCAWMVPLPSVDPKSIRLWRTMVRPSAVTSVSSVFTLRESSWFSQAQMTR